MAPHATALPQFLRQQAAAFAVALLLSMWPPSRELLPVVFAQVSFRRFFGVTDPGVLRLGDLHALLSMTAIAVVGQREHPALAWVCAALGFLAYLWLRGKGQT